jgi:hypothetical protein
VALSFLSSFLLCWGCKVAVRRWGGFKVYLALSLLGLCTAIRWWVFFKVYLALTLLGLCTALRWWVFFKVSLTLSLPGLTEGSWKVVNILQSLFSIVTALANSLIPWRLLEGSRMAESSRSQPFLQARWLQARRQCGKVETTAQPGYDKWLTIDMNFAPTNDRWVCIVSQIRVGHLSKWLALNTGQSFV